MSVPVLDASYINYAALANNLLHHSACAKNKSFDKLWYHNYIERHKYNTQLKQLIESKPRGFINIHGKEACGKTSFVFNYFDKHSDHDHILWFDGGDSEIFVLQVVSYSRTSIADYGLSLGGDGPTLVKNIFDQLTDTVIVIEATSEEDLSFIQAFDLNPRNLVIIISKAPLLDVADYEIAAIELDDFDEEEVNQFLAVNCTLPSTDVEAFKTFLGRNPMTLVLAHEFIRYFQVSSFQLFMETWENKSSADETPAEGNLLHEFVKIFIDEIIEFGDVAVKFVTDCTLGVTEVFPTAVCNCSFDKLDDVKRLLAIHQSTNGEYIWCNYAVCCVIHEFIDGSDVENFINTVSTRLDQSKHVSFSLLVEIFAACNRFAEHFDNVQLLLPSIEKLFELMRRYSRANEHFMLGILRDAFGSDPSISGSVGAMTYLCYLLGNVYLSFNDIVRANTVFYRYIDVLFAHALNTFLDYDFTVYYGFVNIYTHLLSCSLNLTSFQEEASGRLFKYIGQCKLIGYSFVEALNAFKNALPIYEAINNEAGVISSLTFIVICNLLLSDPQSEFFINRLKARFLAAGGNLDMEHVLFSADTIDKIGTALAKDAADKRSSLFFKTALEIYALKSGECADDCGTMVTKLAAAYEREIDDVDEILQKLDQIRNTTLQSFPDNSMVILNWLGSKGMVYFKRRVDLEKCVEIYLKCEQMMKESPEANVEDLAACHYSLADAYLVLQDYETSYSYFTKSIESYTAARGEFDKKTIECNVGYSFMLYDRRYYKECIIVSEEAIRRCLAASRFDKLPDALVNAGLAHKQLFELTEALKCFDQAIEYVKKANNGIVPPDYQDIYVDKSVTYKEMREFGLAKESLQIALDLVKSRANPKDKLTSDLLTDMGSILITLGKLDEAKKYYDEALELRLSLFGELHESIAESYNVLGMLEKARANYSGSIDFLKKAKEIYIRLYGSTHKSIAMVINNIGLVNKLERNFTEAIENFKISLEMYRETTQNQPQTDVSTVLHNLGNALESVGRAADALPYLFEALEIDKLLHKEDHPVTASTLNSIGLSLKSNNQLNEALEMFEKSLALYKAQVGDYQQDIATVIANKGLVYDLLFKFDLAIQSYTEAIAMRGDCTDPDSKVALANNINSLGIVQKNSGHYEDALKSFTQSLEIYKSVVPPNDPNIAVVTENIGLVHELMGSYDEAIRIYQEAMSMRKTVYGEIHETIAMSHNNVALALRAKGDLKEAIQEFTAALSIYRAVYGENHRDIATVIDNLGSTYEMNKEFGLAEEKFQEALKVREAAGDSQAAAAKSYNNMGNIHKGRNEIQESLKYYNMALDIYRSLGQGHLVDVALVLNNIGLMYRQLEKTQEAFKYLHESLELYEKVFGPIHIDVATLTNNIGNVHEMIGEYDEALALYQKSYSILQQLSFQREEAIPAVLKSIGLVYKAKGEYDAAIEKFQESLKLYQDLHGGPGAKHREIAFVLSSIALVLEYQMRFDEGLKMYEDSFAMLKDIGDERSEYAASILNSMGLIHKSMKKYDESLDYFKQSIELYTALYGEKHRDVATVLSNMALSYELSGRYELALEYNQRSLDMRLELFGPDHISIGMSYNNIGLVYKAQKKYFQSIEPFTEAVRIYSDRKQYEAEVASILNNLGLAYRSCNQIDLALKCLLQSLEKYQNVHQGKPHQDVATLFNNTGLALEVQGKYDEAIEYYNKSLVMRQELYGPSHESIASTLNCLALSSKSKGPAYAEDAKRYFQQSLDMYISLFGEENNDVATVYSNLGIFYESQRNYEAALEKYKKSIHIRELIGMDRNEFQATTYNCMGLTLKALGRIEEAMVAFEISLDIYKQVYGDLSMDVATVNSNLALMYDISRQHARAIELYNTTLTLLEQLIPAKPDEFKASTLNNIGLALKSIGSYEQSMQNFQNALAMYIQVYGEAHQDVATVYYNIGLVYDIQGSYDTAVEYYMKTLGIRKSLFGESDITIASTLNCLGLAYKSLKQPDVSFDYFSQSLTMYRSVCGEDTDDVATVLSNIGLLKELNGEFEAALTYYSDSLAIRDRLNSNQTVFTASTLNGLGLVYKALGRYPEGLDAFQKSQAIYRQIYGEFHRDVATLYNNMGLLHELLAQFYDAFEAYDSSLRINRYLHGECHETVASSLNCLGLLYKSLGFYEKSLRSFQLSFVIYYQCGPHNAQNVAVVKDNTGIVFETIREYDNAIDSYKQALEFYVAASPTGELCDSVAATYNNIGNVYNIKRDWVLAKEFYAQSLRLYSQLYPPTHQNNIVVQGNINMVEGFIINPPPENGFPPAENQEEAGAVEELPDDDII